MCLFSYSVALNAVIDCLLQRAARQLAACTLSLPSACALVFPRPPNFPSGSGGGIETKKINNGKWEKKKNMKMKTGKKRRNNQKMEQRKKKKQPKKT